MPPSDANLLIQVSRHAGAFPSSATIVADISYLADNGETLILDTFKLRNDPYSL
jgi:hypothetical protein